MQKQALLMVPNRRGALVVNGLFVPRLAKVPDELSSNLGNVVLNRPPLRGSGPFEIRFDAPPARETIAIDGYVPLYLGIHRKAGGATAPILVERVSLSDETAETAEGEEEAGADSVGEAAAPATR